MAAARAGVAGTVGAGGVYACASEKEEFGLALLEAMATGLSVLGPSLGGPPTFIADGVTGTIANTATVAGVRAGLRRAAAARLDPERAAGRTRDRARAFTIDAMAAGLVDLYRRRGVTTLLDQPGLRSHYFGLATLGHERRRRGGRVVVATGPALRERVLADGFEHVELRLGAGHNDGVAARAGIRRARDHLRAFFDATRRGMAATIAYQVKARGHDMLWRPEQVTRGSARSSRASAPPRRRRPTGVRGLAGAARAGAALRLVPAQPPVPAAPARAAGRLPAAVPERAPAAHAELAALRELCEAQTRDFTRALQRRAAAPEPVRRAGGRGRLGRRARADPRGLSGRARARRRAAAASRSSGPWCAPRRPTRALRRALARRRPGRPTVYVEPRHVPVRARGRAGHDRRGALRCLDVNVVMSTGIADPRALGPLPEHWHVAPSLAQVAALAACDAVICHGGNNTVMEALTAGVPVLAGPFSSDQFAAAEDLRRGGVGDAFAPNQATADELARRLGDLLGAGPRGARPRKPAPGAPGGRAGLGPDRGARG